MSRTIIKNKGDALYEIAKKRQSGEYKTTEETDEAWLRWFIYGDLEIRNPCTIYDTLMNGNTYKDTFPSAFAKQLIRHLMDCDVCYVEYNSSEVKK